MGILIAIAVIIAALLIFVFNQQIQDGIGKIWEVFGAVWVVLWKIIIVILAIVIILSVF